MDNKGIKFRKRSKPLPDLSRNFYKEYKLYDDLGLDELRDLISYRKREIKYKLKNLDLKNKENYYQYKKDKSLILLIERIYKIRLNENPEDFKYLSINEYSWLNYYYCSTKIIDQLGYTNNLIYKEEANQMCKSLQKISTNINISYLDEEYISICIIKEILEYYNAKFDEKLIINNYNIDENKFYDYFTSIHNWCKKNYWRN